MFVTFVIVLFVAGMILSGHLVFGHAHQAALDEVQKKSKLLTYMDDEVAAIKAINEVVGNHFGTLNTSRTLTPFKKVRPREREQWWIDTWLDSWKRQVGSPYVALEGAPDYVEPPKTYIDATKVPVEQLKQQYPTPKMTGYVEPLKPDRVYDNTNIVPEQFYTRMNTFMSELALERTYAQRQRQRQEWELRSVKDRDFYAQTMVRPKMKAVSLYTGGYDADVTQEEEDRELIRRLEALYNKKPRY